MLNLSADEQAWLDEYRRQLAEQFPGLVEDIIIFGPYARGISDPDVDFNTLVLIKEGDRNKAGQVSYLGHMLDMTGFFVAPTIFVRNAAEWAKSKRDGGWMYDMVCDGISAL
ncbi:MAG: hypothetical protein OXI54_08125 [Chloroflexota bacterium]|nr:hypothetical protein [Chloroflexota bacterium]